MFLKWNSRSGLAIRSREISSPNRKNLSVANETLTKEVERGALLTVTEERQRDSFEMSRSSAKRTRARINTFVLQSGEKNIDVAFLMPNECRGIGLKGHLCSLCVEGE
jgi:hypothetical protein